MAKTEAPAKACGNCTFFVAPKAAAEGVDTSKDFRGVYTVGDCIRFPRSEHKRPTEVCGEFSPAKEA